jgi:hypothetical protein
MIRATDTLHTLLARDERVIDVLAAVSPAFEKLRDAGARGVMARLVTVEQAATIARLDVTSLVDRLNQALDMPGGATPASALNAPPAVDVELPAPRVPTHLLRISPDKIVDADVREELRAGREPFRTILEAARATPPEGVLRVRAIFEPAPLYAVLAKQGFSHFTERIAADDWRVWFHRDGPVQAASSSPQPDASQAAPGDDLILLDVRGLEPPEPMVRTLEALASMPRGKTLVQVNVRVPQFLLPKLDQRGFVYEIREQSADLVRLFIRHKES